MMTKEKKESVLYNHATNAHPDQTLTPLDYRYEVTGKYKSPLERQAGESSMLQLEIEKTKPKNVDDQTKKVNILNSKGEFHKPAGLVKVDVKSYFDDQARKIDSNVEKKLYKAKPSNESLVNELGTETIVRNLYDNVIKLNSNNKNNTKNLDEPSEGSLDHQKEDISEQPGSDTPKFDNDIQSH